jgi:hypothetical protein
MQREAQTLNSTMDIYGELLGLSGLLMRGLGTPRLHRMRPYLDSLVVLSDYELTGRFGFDKSKL